MFNQLQQYAKAIVALVGSLGVAGTIAIPEEWAHYVAIGVAVLTAFATFQVPNAPATDSDGPDHLAD